MLISTENTEDFWAKLLSLPSWERGLKLLQMLYGAIVVTSLPSWERGLKPLMICIKIHLPSSRSPRGSVD